MRRFAPVLFLAAVLSSTLALAGTIDFFEGNHGEKDKVGTVNDEIKQYNLKMDGAPVKNNEARSLKLNGVKAGTIITVCDDEMGREAKGDYCVIEVLKEVQQYTVDSFEKTYTDDVVKVTYSKDSGLDGKVSNIQVARP